MSIHPSYDASRQISRLVNDLPTFERLARVSKWHYEFYTSKEGQDIRVELESAIATQLNNFTKRNFNYIEWKNIKALNLCYGNLTSLPHGVFDSLTNLRMLGLSDNKLTSLSQGAFDSLTNLTHLYLEYNKITSLPNGVFSNLINLQQLYLQNNELTSLPDGVFDSLTNLTNLSLSNNELTSLPQGVFDSLTNLKLLTLYDNPLEIKHIPTLKGVRIYF